MCGHQAQKSIPVVYKAIPFSAASFEDVISSEIIHNMRDRFAYKKGKHFFDVGQYNFRGVDEQIKSTILQKKERGVDSFLENSRCPFMEGISLLSHIQYIIYW